MIGIMCTRSNVFSRDILIGRVNLLSFQKTNSIVLYYWTILLYLKTSQSDELSMFDYVFVCVLLVVFMCWKVTPVPIPNTEVKLSIVDDTALI